MNYENCKADSVYNVDYRWPKKIKRISKKQPPICTICEPFKDDKPLRTEEYERILLNFQKLFERFPYLKDVLCKMQPHDVSDLIKEKHETTYNYDFKSKQHDDNISNKNSVDEGDDEECFRPNNRSTLKSKQVQGALVGYSGIAPPEPYQVPKSEYRSTIHMLGTHIIKKKLLVPKMKNQ